LKNSCKIAEIASACCHNVVYLFLSKQQEARLSPRNHPSAAHYTGG